MEFQADLQQQLVFLLRLILSSVCGMDIGWERESRNKNAGIRTHMVVAMASALMVIISKYGCHHSLFRACRGITYSGRSSSGNRIYRSMRNIYQG